MLTPQGLLESRLCVDIITDLVITYHLTWTWTWTRNINVFGVLYCLYNLLLA